LSGGDTKERERINGNRVAVEKIEEPIMENLL
jgi:hypothetical protein